MNRPARITLKIAGALLALFGIAALALLAFVDVRFRPGVQVPEADIHEFYEKQYIPEWKQTHTGTPPGFEESKAEVENSITADIADHALDRWLGQTRTQTQILFRREVFQ